jgi:hypothetical protein
VTVSELPPLRQSDARPGDTTEVSVNEQPANESAPLVAAANQTPADAEIKDEPSSPATSTAADARPSTTAVADLTPQPTVANEAAAEPNEPAAHNEAAEHVALATPADFPLPRERPSSAAQTEAPAAATAPERRPGLAGAPAKRSPAAVSPSKRPRVVASAVRIVRFTSVYYTQAQYVQSAEQGYGYGQNGDAAQEPIVVRRVARPRLVARRAY